VWDLLESAGIVLKNQLFSNRFAAAIRIDMVINWEIGQCLIPIDDLLTAKDNIACATVDKPFDAEVEASVDNMASTINVDFIDATKLEHLFAWHSEGRKVEYAVGTAEDPFHVFFAGNIPFV